MVLGFHGCDKTIRDEVISKEGVVLKPSKNAYDWLGNGVYFWENNCQRALEFAIFLKENPPHNSKQRIREPAVIGAVIDLGFCFDLLDSEYLKLLKEGYNFLEKSHKQHGLNIPENSALIEGGDLVKRHLDCAVIETVHQVNRDKGRPGFDTVRGVFFEGKDLYANAGFKERNHIQIAVRNPNCIKGYFVPRELDSGHSKPGPHI